MRAPCYEFPQPYTRLEAPREKGIYVILSPRGKIMHVGATPVRGAAFVKDCLTTCKADQLSPNDASNIADIC
jgi:hypothetical protein